MTENEKVQGVHVAPCKVEMANTLLSKDCLSFLAELSRNFTEERNLLLKNRKLQQEKLDQGELFDFPHETENIRKGDWKAAPFPEYLAERRVEITGPSSDPKMVINAFNSGANVYMSDFEDAQSPFWELMMLGQENLYRAVRHSLVFTSEEGKEYRMNDKTAILFVRPRGLHLDEAHVHVDGKLIPGSFFDFGVYFFNNAKELIKRSLVPTFYIPKTESYLEARLWDKIFTFSEKYLGLENGTIKATFLVETLPAAFQMDEIIYETKNHSLGLNCGRWDYIFSYIKKLRSNPDFVLPDRSEVTMDKGFLLAYSRLLIRTCHRRGVHAMGGMSAFIPVKGDEEKNRVAFQKVREDKEREAGNGHDGTWVAHPGIVPVAKEAFDKKMPSKNQISLIPEVSIGRKELITPVTGKITEEGLRSNIRIGIRYLEAWIGGKGAVPLYNLMEDAATSEICRTQIWQWIKHKKSTDNGLRIDRENVSRIIGEEVSRLNKTPELEIASELFKNVVMDSGFVEFFTIPAYEKILKMEGY